MQQENKCIVNTWLWLESSFCDFYFHSLRHHSLTSYVRCLILDLVWLHIWTEKWPISASDGSGWKWSRTPLSDLGFKWNLASASESK